MAQAELCIFLVQTRGLQLTTSIFADVHGVAVNIHLVDDRTTGERGDFGRATAQA